MPHLLRELNFCRSLRSLSEKGISLCNLCAPLCLCGEMTCQNLHHRGTEVTQRTTEPFFPTDSSAGLVCFADVYLGLTPLGFMVSPAPQAGSVYFNEL